MCEVAQLQRRAERGIDEACRAAGLRQKRDAHRPAARYDTACEPSTATARSEPPRRAKIG